MRVGLSFDIDSVASHLVGYGFERPEDDGAAYRVAVPRILDLLARHDARATFFLIGAEAQRFPQAVAAIVAGNHEIASHSMTHPLPFPKASGIESDRELERSKAVLEDLAGKPVAGFRAPSWDVERSLLEREAAAGYRYDASGYPSILLPLLRIAVRSRARNGRTPVGRIGWSEAFGPTLPRRVDTPAGSIVAWPMCVTPFLRLPYYHTFRLSLPGPAFALVRRLARAGRCAVWYQFHAVDFLGLEEDGIDPRIRRHPGMRRRLASKLEAADAELRALARRGTVVPLVELADDV